MRKLTLTAIVAAAALVAGLQKYSGFSLPQPQGHSPVTDRHDIAKNAEAFVGTPYNVDRTKGMVCTDVYVTAAGLSERIIEDGRARPEHYSAFNERLPVLAQNLAYLGDVFRLSDFNNTPDNSQFPRRIQNVLSFQAANGTFLSGSDTPVQAGYAIYFTDGSSEIPSHMGVVGSVDSQGRPQEVIHASSRAGRVVKDSLHEILAKGYRIAGFGYVPK